MLKFLNIRQLTAVFAVAATLVLLCSCSRAANSFGGSEKPDRSGAVSLALVGYNYTNRHIDSFSVDGQGGGNLFVSSPTSGGGGTVCCVSYWPGVTNYKVKVRWQSDGCYYRERASDSNEIYDSLHDFFKEIEVPVTEEFSGRPENLEVHFYPDGSVQVVVTAEASLPRLSLSQERKDKTKYPRCPNDKKPSQ